MKKIFLVFLFPLIIFWPSLFVFFTNDDFFFLKVSKANNIVDVLNFFNVTHGPEGFGFYRPITTQSFYLVRDSLAMHLIVFITFFAILYLIYRVSLMLFNSEKAALVSVFLYSVSATHFAHFYYLATFQELGMTLFVLLTIFLLVQKKYFFSILTFVLALMSKETAVVTPILLLLINWYLNLKTGSKKLLVHFVILGIYLYLHLFAYGVTSGDTYVWDFSVKRLLNTTFWYLLWSLNLPETLVDFVGPGLQINPNLFRYWSSTIWPILVLFIMQLLFIVYILIKLIRDSENKRQSFFAMAWFLVSLSPVILLPQHKFSYFLTLPLIGITYRIGYLIDRNKLNYFLLYSFLITWTSLSVLTIVHSKNTSWITNGQLVSKSVHEFFSSHNFGSKEISFRDSEKDIDLPWSPTAVLKNALSDRNYFYVYFPSIAEKISYGTEAEITIHSRQFLGY